MIDSLQMNFTVNRPLLYVNEPGPETELKWEVEMFQSSVQEVGLLNVVSFKPST